MVSSGGWRILQLRWEASGGVQGDEPSPGTQGFHQLPRAETLVLPDLWVTPPRADLGPPQQLDQQVLAKGTPAGGAALLPLPPGLTGGTWAWAGDPVEEAGAAKESQVGSLSPGDPAPSPRPPLLKGEPSSALLKKIFIYLFIWLHQALVSAGRLLSCGMRTLSCGMHVGSSSLFRDRTQAPCIGSMESYPLRHQGSPPSSAFQATFIWRCPDTLSWAGSQLVQRPPDEGSRDSREWGDQRRQRRGTWMKGVSAESRRQAFRNL